MYTVHVHVCLSYVIQLLLLVINRATCVYNVTPSMYMYIYLCILNVQHTCTCTCTSNSSHSESISSIAAIDNNFPDIAYSSEKGMDTYSVYRVHISSKTSHMCEMFIHNLSTRTVASYNVFVTNLYAICHAHVCILETVKSIHTHTHH